MHTPSLLFVSMLEKKRAEKEKVYQMIDDAAREIVNDPEKFMADSDGNNVFTNYTETKNSFAANKIFNYLYSQAQTDYNGEFVPVETENAEVSAYKIDGKYAYLIKKGNTITLFTVSENADKKDIEKIATDLINK